MRFEYNEINYITVLKQFYPSLAVSGYSDPKNYDSIVFSLNGNAKPTKAELDALINQVSVSQFIQDVGQALKTYFIPVGRMSGTSVLTLDNNLPKITEGTQIASFTTTPLSLSSKFSFSATFMVDSNTSNRNVGVALFRDNLCVYSNITNVTAGRPVNLNIEAFDTPNTLSPVTYTVRLGVNASATWYLNQTNAGASNGGTTTTPIRISEYS